MDLAPIILFVYNRPWHTRQALEALMANELAAESRLYIYSDAPKGTASQEELDKVNEVRSLLIEKQWCKEVIVRERYENFGLAESIIQGVTEVIEEHGKVIVLEDDIKTDSLFLSYMNKALSLYQKEKHIYHINGYNNESNLQFLLKDFYLLHFMSCWGWATWEDRWNQMNYSYEKIYRYLKNNPNELIKFNYDNSLDFDLQLIDNINGNIKTWAILWYSTIFLKNGLCVTPKYTLVENIGLDGTGINRVVNSVHKRSYKPLSALKTDKIKIKSREENYLSRYHLKMFYKYGKNFSLRQIIKSHKN